MVHRRENVPPERDETPRQAILATLLEAHGKPLSAKDISYIVSLPEKDVYAHLEHLQRSRRTTPKPLQVTPAHCKRCGFSFAKRDRLTRPSKCPVCKAEQIQEPLFTIEPEEGQ